MTRPANRRTLTALVVATGLAAAPGAHAAVIAEWDFGNATIGQISGIAASSTGAGVSGALFNTANNGVESFPGANNVSVTRFFDSTNNTPSLTFTLASALTLDSLSFLHIHNHNPGFPTNPDYEFDIQIDSGSGFTSIVTDQIASAATSNTTASFGGLGLALGAGTHTIRWIGNDFAFGTNSNTEFFALDNVRLETAAVPLPAPLALFGTGLLALGAGMRRRSRG